MHLRTHGNPSPPTLGIPLSSDKYYISGLVELVCTIYSGKIIGNLQLTQGKYYTFHLQNSGKTQGKKIPNLYEPCDSKQPAIVILH